MAGTTFYHQQSANRRNSLLMAGFVILLLGLLGFSVGYAIFGTPAGGVGTTVFALTLGVLSGVGTYFSGDKLVLAVSGARRVDPAQAPQLMNVVSELCIAANIPVPDVYLIDDTAPNAFATGRDPAHASIAITTGLLEKLDREELQGVIGHELSHVANLDIRFSLIVAVMVGAIALLADFFLRFTFWGGNRRSRDDSGGGGGGAQAVIRDHRHRAGDPRADHQPVHPARGQPPARVPGRRLIRGADAQPVGPRAGARQDLVGPRGPRGRQPRRPSTCTSRTRSRSSRNGRQR